MILNQLSDNIILEEVSKDASNISILTRPLYEIEIDDNFNSIIYTSKEIKAILIKKLNKIPDRVIVTVPFNQWTKVIKVQQHSYRLAGIDMGTISLHFMVLIENLTQNEMYLYTGDFFTIERLGENDFFKENLPRIKKVFFDNKIIKYDLKTYLEIISTFIKQKIANYSFALCLPHLGYEDFLDALIKNFNMSVHVNELRKLLLRKSLVTSDDTFVDKDGSQPKLIVHKKSKSLTEIKKLYYKYQICTLSFSHLNEFSSKTPNIVDYYLTMLQWDQHPTESMVLELFGMLPKNTEFNLIYEEFPCPKAILVHVCANAITDSNDYSADDFALSDHEDISDVNESQITFSDNSEFLPQYFSSQLPSGNQPPIPIEVNHIIQTNGAESLPSSSEENVEMAPVFCIEDYRNLDLGNDIKYLRFNGTKTS